LNTSSLSAYGVAAQALATALLNSAANPADAVRMLSQLATFTSTGAASNSPVAGAIAVIQTESAALFRRAAIAALAVATSRYQPTSFTDAQNQLNAFTTLIDGEILIAADNGDDQTYGAFRSLRQAVVADLTSRGGQLAALQTFSFNESMPALALANLLYQDGTRSDQLVAQVVPRHPAFMPTKFQALSQ